MNTHINKQQNIIEIDLKNSDNFDELLYVIRNFPDRRKFNPDTKKWEILISRFNLFYFQEKLFEFLNESDKPDFINLLEEFNLSGLKKEPIHSNKIEWNCVPYEHQKTGFDILVNNQYAALFWEQGVGKTLPVIKLIEYFRDFKLNFSFMVNFSILIVCPKNVIIPWKIQFEQFTRHKPVIIEGSKKEREQVLKSQSFLYLVNYDLLRLMKPDLIKKNFSMIVFDESQYIKNPTSQRSVAAEKISQNIDRRYLLTGTPIGNRELDLFQQYKILNPEIFGDNYYRFRGFFFESKGGFKFLQWKENGQVYRKSIDKLSEVEVEDLKKNRKAILIDTSKADNNFSLKESRKELFKKLVESASWRLTKDMVLDLPEKIYQSIYLDMEKEQEKYYNAIKNEILDFPGLKELSLNVLIAKMGKLNQICSGFLKIGENKKNVIFDKKTKIEAMSTLWEDMGKPKLTIWCFYHIEMDMIINFFKKKKVKVGKIDGRNKKDETEKYIKDFQDGDLEILVCQEQAASVGLTLTTAHYAFIHLRTYSLLNRLQLEDRIHRIGQKENVTIIDFIYKDTIEEQILQALEQKRDLARDMLGDNSAFVKGIIKEFKKRNKRRR